MWWRTVIRLAAGLLVLFGVSAGATMALSQDDGVSPDCELGILFESAAWTVTDSNWLKIGIYWVRSDGSELERILTYADIPSGFSNGVRSALSPDRQWLAYSYWEYGSDLSYLSLLNFVTGEIIPLAENMLNQPSVVSWSPDSTKIAYGNGYSINVIDIVQHEEWQIFYASSQEYGHAYLIDWFNNGQEVVVTFFRSLGETGYSTTVRLNIYGANPPVTLRHDYRSLRLIEDQLYYLCYPETGPRGICRNDFSGSNETFVSILPDGIWIINFDIAPNGQIVFSYLANYDNPATPPGSVNIGLFNPNSEEFTLVSRTSAYAGEGSSNPPRWFCRPPQLSETGA